MTSAARKETILRIIVNEYVAKAVPVASETIASSYNLKVSPATIRNDMARLEEEGYITRPHRSAGSIPTDRGYRCYVGLIRQGIELPTSEQSFIYKVFHEPEREIEQWLKLAAMLLARSVHNMAIVTIPRAPRCRFKHLDLVALQDFVALLILVLYQARIKQQILSFTKKVTQDELATVANKLNAAYAGMTVPEITSGDLELSDEEEQVTRCIVDRMAAEDKKGFGKPYLEGLHLMLSQPEFARSFTIINILELIEQEDWLGKVFSREPGRGETEVIIGEENAEEALQDLSLVLSRYGIPDKASGIVGVLGPKRMDYTRTISSVNYLSSLLSKSVVEYI